MPASAVCSRRKLQEPTQAFTQVLGGKSVNPLAFLALPPDGITWSPAALRNEDKVSRAVAGQA